MAAAAAPLTCWAEGCAALSTSACGRCRTAEYCGAPCQRAHWRAHKPRCKELEAAADAAEAAAEAASAAAAAAAAVPAGGVGAPLHQPRLPGVYSGLECRVQDFYCALVGCDAALEAGGAGLVCSGCRAVVYCDVECQAAHWAAHMEACFVAVANRVQSGDVHQGDEGGEYVLRDMLHVCRTRFGAADERTLQCVSVLGEMMQGQGKLAEAGALYKESLAARRAALGPDHPDTLDSMRHLASLLHAQGAVGEAEPLMRDALDAARATLGPRHGLTLTFMSVLAGMLRELDMASEAESLYREALAARLATRRGGSVHSSAQVLTDGLGILLQMRGKLSEAEPLFTSVLNVRRTSLGLLHPYTLVSIGHLGGLLLAQGRLSEAEPLLCLALQAALLVLGVQHPSSLTSSGALAALQLAQGKPGEAEPLLRETLRCQRAFLGAQHPSTLDSMRQLGGALLRLCGGRKGGAQAALLREAEALLSEALVGFCRVLGHAHPRTKAAAAALEHYISRWR